MPWLETHRSGVFHIVMRFQERKYKQSLKTKNHLEADAQLAKVKFNLHLCEMGRLEIPESVHPLTFLLADGKVGEKTNGSQDFLIFEQLVADFSRQFQTTPWKNQPSTKCKLTADTLSAISRTTSLFRP